MHAIHDFEMRCFDDEPDYAAARAMVAASRGAVTGDPLRRALVRQLRSLLTEAEKQFEAAQSARYAERVASSALSGLKAEIDALTDALATPADKAAA